jgi:hypothetical protein
MFPRRSNRRLKVERDEVDISGISHQIISLGPRDFCDWVPGGATTRHPGPA